MRLVHLTKSRWPKIGKNLTKKNWQQRTLTLELDTNFTTTNINRWIWPKYCETILNIKVRVPFRNIYHIFNFRSYSPIHVRCCGNIFYIFGQLHHVNVRHQLFGHVHQFRSYSFGQVNNPKKFDVFSTIAQDDKAFN